MSTFSTSSSARGFEEGGGRRVCGVVCAVGFGRATAEVPGAGCARVELGDLVVLVGLITKWAVVPDFTLNVCSRLTVSRALLVDCDAVEPPQAATPQTATNPAANADRFTMRRSITCSRSTADERPNELLPLLKQYLAAADRRAPLARRGDAGYGMIAVTACERR